MALTETINFNSTERVMDGWYWALRSRDVKRGRVKPVTLLGRELAVYRTDSGKAVAVDAYCPHMGAHLAEGSVDGEALRCFFHHWKFEQDGRCSEAPQLAQPPAACIATHVVEERYGLIWIWVGAGEPQPMPEVPELRGEEVDWSHGNTFIKDCHPNVVMINAIDAHHFNSVHNLPVELEFAVEAEDARTLHFANTTRVPETRALTRFISRFYEGPLTYKMCYWSASTGTVSIGPDFMHFHIMFALRMVEGGKTEGQTILITRRRPGLTGKLFNAVTLFATKIVGNYFAKGDTQIFRTIRFNFATPTKADRSIIDFIQHAEAQPAVSLGDWRRCVPADSASAAESGAEPTETVADQPLEVGDELPIDGSLDARETPEGSDKPAPSSEPSRPELVSSGAPARTSES